MDAAEYAAFTDRLLARLADDPEVLGLVALGSMSGAPPLPDAFSDHDFFVVVEEGAQERYRTDLSWLPGAPDLAFSYRETAHGLKALWADGHLAEFAVFSLEELALARVNRYRVLLDRADVAARMARVLDETATRARNDAPDERWSAGMFLGALVVGSGRWARGERLSGHQQVRFSAVGHLVALLRGRGAPVDAALLDDLDPWRRLERAAPGVASELDRALLLPAPAAARSLLALLVRHRPELLSEAARAAVGRALDAAERAGDPSGQPPSPGLRPQDGG
jgi:hypothetical protein